jgi:glycogen debranching enzyme
MAPESRRWEGVNALVHPLQEGELQRQQAIQQEDGFSTRRGASIRPTRDEVISVEQLNRMAPDVLPYLRPNDLVIHVEALELRRPSRAPSALRALLQLTQSSCAREIGAHGAVIASGATEENHDVSPELRIFEVVFGRDSLRVALTLHDHYPALARATVLTLAAAQGVATDLPREEEPGRIPHELRDPGDPIAVEITRCFGWQWPYYGSVDATPLFVQALVGCWRREPEVLDEPVVGRDGLTRPLGDCLDRAVDWICRRMDASSLGLLEFTRTWPNGIENQGWRDSWDSYVHADGKVANHGGGVAALEVQALAYDALLDAAEVYDARRDRHRASCLRARAEGLRAAVHERFWVGDDRAGWFGLGVDRDRAGQPRVMAVRTADMGHLLCSRILDGDSPRMAARRESVIRTLFSQELLCGAGLRSMASTELRFHPGGYHLGSSWLWETCLVADGLDRHGYHGLAHELRRRCFRVVDKFRKFPEYARGDGDSDPQLTTRVVDIYSSLDHRRNRFEQPPQEVQAWTVAVMLKAKRQHGARVLGRAGAPPGRASGPQRALEVELLAGMPGRAAAIADRAQRREPRPFEEVARQLTA